jgi:hypothetical protein
MNEELLYYMWNSRILETNMLYTTENELIEIINQGYRNLNSGPDFLHAMIKIGKIKLAGHIEFHIKSSDWNRHKHQNDAAYNNVILHVVVEDDRKIENKAGSNIPTLEIGKLIPENILSIYYELLRSKSKIPCEKILTLPDEAISLQWLERLAIQRLETKYYRIKTRLNECKNNWEEVYYAESLRSFMGSINSAGAEILIHELDYGLIMKYKDQKFNLLALLLGKAGFFEKNIQDKVNYEINKTWSFLRRKHNLNSMAEGIWKFSKTRPANFPSNRLFQFCLFYNAHENGFDTFIKTTSIDNSKLLLNKYLENKTEIKPILTNGKKILPAIYAGNGIRNRLMVNVIAPLIFAFGIEKDNERLKSLALNFWMIAEPEKNGITDFWKSKGLTAQSALESQGMIELNTCYCNQRKCLNCALGNHMIKNHKT